MPTKKKATAKKTTATRKKKAVEKKPKPEIKEEKKAEVLEEIITAPAKTGKYFYAVGRRKTAVAQVKLYPESGSGKKLLVNNREPEKYFSLMRLKNMIYEPFAVTSQEGKFDMSAKVFGGGLSAQAEALRLGISRALIIFDPELRKVLKSLGYLRRDARIVERKKPGLKKARRAPQWAKL